MCMLYLSISMMSDEEITLFFLQRRFPLRRSSINFIVRFDSPYQFAFSSLNPAQTDGPTFFSLSLSSDRQGQMGGSYLPGKLSIFFFFSIRGRRTDET